MNNTTSAEAICTPRKPASRFSRPIEGPMTDCSTIVIGAANEPEEISSDKSFASLAVRPVITKVRGNAVLIVA